MDKNKFLDQLASGRMTRRQFAAGLASVGLGLTTTVTFSRGASAADPKDLVVFTWEGYDPPAMHDAYLKKHGVSPTFSMFGGTEEAFQKLQAGFVADVAHPCVEDVVRWKGAGLIKELDTSRLEHWNNIFPEMLTLPGVVVEGKNYIVPIDWGNGSLLYRTDLVEIQEESWSLAFDERYKGKISMYDATPTVTVAALVAGVNPFEFSEEEGAKVKELLMKQRELVKFYWNSSSEYQQAMAAGEIAIAYAWNDGLKALKKQGLPVKYMMPKEGILTWTCGVVHMAKGESGDDLAYDFLNAMLAPETGKFLIEDYGYGHSNTKSFDLVAKETIDDLGFGSPSDLFSKGVFETEVSPEMEQRRNRLFEGIKMGQ
jgi:spermidine/putrescine transport system substrate-binding protein